MSPHPKVALSRSSGMLPKLHATWRGDVGLTVAAAEPGGNDTQVVAVAEFMVAAGLEARELCIEVEVAGAAGPQGRSLRMTGVVPIRYDDVRRTGGRASHVEVDASRPDSFDLGMRIAIGLLVLAPLLLWSRRQGRTLHHRETERSEHRRDDARASLGSSERSVSL